MGDYDIEVLTSAVPAKIGAMQSVAVPYRITRRAQTASASLSFPRRRESMFDEVTGYGGNNCVQNFQITVRGKCVVCPNTAFARTVEKVANFIVSIFADCPDTITPSTPPSYTLPGGTAIWGMRDTSYL